MDVLYTILHPGTCKRKGCTEESKKDYKTLKGKEAGRKSNRQRSEDGISLLRKGKQQEGYISRRERKELNERRIC